MKSEKIYYSHYESPDAALLALETAPIVPGMCGNRRASDCPHDYGGDSWAETKNFAQAVAKARAGDPEVAKQIRPYECELNPAGNLSKIVYDYAGDTVDVGLFMSGEPECMMSLRRKGKPIVNILVNISASSFVTRQTLEARGKAILEICSGLEANGYGVDITVIVRSGYSSQFSWAVKVKDSKEYFDLHSLAFWLVSPSVLRKLFFRAAETQPVHVQRIIGDSYGVPYDLGKEELDQMPDCIYFPKVTNNDSLSYQKSIKQVLETYQA